MIADVSAFSLFTTYQFLSSDWRFDPPESEKYDHLHDVCADGSVPISLKSNLKLQVQAVTQSLKFCYARCYARPFYVNKKRRKCYTETRYNA